MNPAPNETHEHGRAGAEDVEPPSMRLIVVYRNPQQSLGPLRWAIHESNNSGLRLFVVHQSPIGVGVHNGPSASIAHMLGNPTWATMHSVVRGLGAPADASTIVESVPEHELVARYATSGSQVVVSSKLHARQLRRRLGDLQIEVTRIPKKWIGPPPSATPATPSAARRPHQTVGIKSLQTIS